MQPGVHRRGRGAGPPGRGWKRATFAGARLGSPDSGIALNAHGLTVRQLVLRLAEDEAPVGRVVLTWAAAATVVDGPGLWAATGGVDVEDFTFGSISSEPHVDVRTRLRWLREVVEKHHKLTGSAVAASLLGDWPRRSASFTKVMPGDYQRVLEAMRLARAEGRDVDQAIMEASRG